MGRPATRSKFSHPEFAHGVGDANQSIDSIPFSAKNSDGGKAQFPNAGVVGKVQDASLDNIGGDRIVSTHRDFGDRILSTHRDLGDKIHGPSWLENAFQSINF